MQTIIGFTGKMGVGKTTMADKLSSYLLEKDLEVVRISFASHLKKACSVLFDLPMEYFTDPVKKQDFIQGLGSPRELLQLTGTDFIRKMVNNDFWVQIVEKQCKSFSDSAIIIIDDCRFQNEVHFIQKNKGVVIHLTRDIKTEINIQGGIYPTTGSEHSSEKNELYCPSQHIVHLPNNPKLASAMIEAIVFVELQIRGVLPVLTM